MPNLQALSHFAKISVPQTFCLRHFYYLFLVSSVSELFTIIRANPFIDGLGYFIEIETERPVSDSDVAQLSEALSHDFCEHSSASLDGPHVLGLDFHEHIVTKGDDGKYFLESMERRLLQVEESFGILHLCIEFQFDFGAAKKQVAQLDELLRP